MLLTLVLLLTVPNLSLVTSRCSETLKERVESMGARTKLFLFQHSSHSLLLSPGFFALKISKDFVNPHSAMMNMTK